VFLSAVSHGNLGMSLVRPLVPNPGKLPPKIPKNPAGWVPPILRLNAFALDSGGTTMGGKCIGP